MYPCHLFHDYLKEYIQFLKRITVEGNDFGREQCTVDRVAKKDHEEVFGGE